jgi:hypothetical protein
MVFNYLAVKDSRPHLLCGDHFFRSIHLVEGVRCKEVCFAAASRTCLRMSWEASAIIISRQQWNLGDARQP